MELPNSDPRKNRRTRGSWRKISRVDSHIIRGSIEVLLFAYGKGYRCVARLPGQEIVFFCYLENLCVARKFGENVLLELRERYAEVSQNGQGDQPDRGIR